MTSTTKSLSASQTAVRFGVQEKMARMFMQKVREAMKSSENFPMKGVVNVDEYVVAGYQEERQKQTIMKTTKQLFFTVLLGVHTLVSAQVGIATTTPEGVLDVVSIGQNHGLVIPRVTSSADVVNPQGGAIVNGTIIYDLSDKCIKFYQDDAWTDCVFSAPPTVSSLDNCASPTTSGTLEGGTAASGVNFTINYSGGNGEAYTGEAASSTGVTGLTATLSAGTLATGAGSVIYNVIGTPATSGTASFNITLGGQSCTVDLTVSAAPSTIRVAYTDTYAIGSSNLSTFNSQLTNTSNYGASGTVSTVLGFSFTNITSTLASTSGTALRASYDIISTGFAEVTAIEAANLEAFVDAGGVLFVLLDSSVGTTIHQQFGGTGTIGAGASTVLTNTNPNNNNTFGTGTSVTITGSGSFGAITTAQLPAGATVLALSGTNPGVWLTGTDDRAIFIWDEGVFRHGTITGAINTSQEIWCHNMIVYALNQLGF